MNQLRIFLLLIVASAQGCAATTQQWRVPIDTSSMSSKEETKLTPYIENLGTFLRSTDEKGDYRHLGLIEGFAATEIIEEGEAVVILGCTQFSRGSPKPIFTMIAGNMDEGSVIFTFFNLPYTPDGPPEECE